MESSQRADVIQTIPPPEAVREMLRESVHRTMLLRGVLRLSIRKDILDREATGREEVADAAHRR